MNLTEGLGGLLGFLFTLLFVGLIVLFFVLGRTRPRRNLREIAAFNRFRRAVGLAVEAGKRLHVSIGWGGLLGTNSASAFIGLTMLERCARAASVSDRPPVATSGESLLAVLTQDTLRSTYHDMSAESQYDPRSGRLSGLTPFAYAAGALAVIQDEQISASMLAGHFGSEVALLTEASERAGSLCVAGSDNLPAQAVLYATAQEALIGEDLYAGGAYLGAGPLHAASLHAQDIIRWVLVGAILIGALLKLGGLL